MFLEEFYNYNGNRDQVVSDSMYLHTLACWLINNNFEVYESLIEHYEKIEEYAVCDGISKALNKISDIMHDRFEDAEKVSETDEEVVYTHQEHMRVSSLIFEDILKEIYEKQISKYKENN
jgi:hypothetical protein